MKKDSRDPWGNIKQFNIHVLGILEGNEGHKMEEICIKRVITGNFPNLMDILTYRLDIISEPQKNV